MMGTSLMDTNEEVQTSQVLYKTQDTSDEKFMICLSSLKEVENVMPLNCCAKSVCLADLIQWHQVNPEKGLICPGCRTQYSCQNIAVKVHEATRLPTGELKEPIALMKVMTIDSISELSDYVKKREKRRSKTSCSITEPDHLRRLVMDTDEPDQVIMKMLGDDNKALKQVFSWFVSLSAPEQERILAGGHESGDVLFDNHNTNSTSADG